MSDLIFLAPSGGTVTLTNADTASTINVTLPATNGTLLIADTSNNLTVNNLTVTGIGTFNGTGQIYLPVGNTAQRTGSPTEGLIRYNTDGGGFYEGYAAGDWKKFTVTSQLSYQASYVCVAGGGGGGDVNTPYGYGGGAGGYLTGTFTIISSTIYTITIGAGGTGFVGSTDPTNGNDSLISGIANSIGGGAGIGANGGSGGGGGGLGTVGQGNNGGSSSQYASGGGGGAGAVGGNGVSGNGGNGGIGLSTNITGSTIYLAGGGAGAGQISDGTGGNGGGGNVATSGSANTGGGGGGTLSSPRLGGAGGSGVVYLSVPTANYTGTTTGSPTVTTNGSFTVMKFTASGSYTG